MNMLIKFDCTLKTIEYSDCYENNQKLFDNGIKILRNRIVKNDFSEFNDNEREILENIFTVIYENE